MANEIPLPAVPGFEAVEWSLERNVSTFESPLTKVSQRVGRIGNRWRARMRFPLYNGVDAGVLAGWLEQIARGDRWFFLTPPHNNPGGGNWNPAELVSNGTFLAGVTTGWTASSSTLSVNARRLKVLNTAAANGIARQNVTMEVGKPHVLMADAYLGKVPNSHIRVVRQSDSVSEASTSLVAPTRGVLLVTPTVAPMRAELLTNTSVSGDFVYYGGSSLTRCLQVSGGSQTGVRLNVDGGPASINAALRAGEFVSVLTGGLMQLVRLVEDFDTDSGGAGTLVFEPALRAAPADDAAVIVRGPYARFRVMEHLSSQAVVAPNFNGFTIDAIEDISP